MTNMMCFKWYKTLVLNIKNNNIKFWKNNLQEDEKKIWCRNEIWMMKCHHIRVLVLLYDYQQSWDLFMIISIAWADHVPLYSIWMNERTFVMEKGDFAMAEYYLNYILERACMYYIKQFKNQWLQILYTKSVFLLGLNWAGPTW